MPKVQLWGFRCERCGHEWLPRDLEQQPQVCPKCKSPYWDHPRKDRVRPEHHVRCKWQAHELDGKTVEFELIRGKKPKEGVGWFTAHDLGDGTIQILIKEPMSSSNEAIRLVQGEADLIETHMGKCHFIIRSRP